MPSALLGAGVGFLAVSGVILGVSGGAGAVQGVQQGRLIERGADLYGTYCQTCHGDREGIGRQLGVPSHGRDGHTWHHSDRNLKETIFDGAPGMGESLEMMGVPESDIAEVLREEGLPEGWQWPRMPAWRDTLSDQEVDALLAYIKTFWTPEERRRQQETPMMP